jgi:hypothetical protein
VADDARTPVAIRISRPYASEEEFLRHELDTLTRTTVVLLGAQSRPQGVVLRFEVALASGDALIRGEGRVVGFRAASQGVDSGLTLRFTRLDARSKALVDRAAGMRDARARPSIHPSRPAMQAVPAPPPLPPPPPAPSGPGALSLDLGASTQPSLEEEPVSSGQILPSSGEAARMVARPRFAPPPPSSGSLGPMKRARRDELLDRLRQRAKTLTPSAIETLLASRVRRA